MEEKTLQMIADKLEITELLTRYADRIDANDPEGAAACFTENGLGIYWGEYRGRRAIAERIRGIIDDYKATSHHLSNVMIDLNGDRATSQSYVYAFHRMKADSKFFHVWGRWMDDLVKIDGSWYIAKREVLLVGFINEDNPPKDRQDFAGHSGRLP